jgi:hypothetical protein
MERDITRGDLGKIAAIKSKNRASPGFSLASTAPIWIAASATRNVLHLFEDY